MVSSPNPRLLLGVFVALVVVLVSARLVLADSGGSNAGSAMNIAVVGHHDLGGRGYNADV